MLQHSRMIVLGIGHPMLKEQVLQRSGPDNAEYRERNPLEMKIADFDDVTYCLKAIDNNLTVFFSMQGDTPAVRACAVPASAPPRPRADCGGLSVCSAVSASIATLHPALSAGPAPRCSCDRLRADQRLRRGGVSRKGLCWR